MSLKLATWCCPIIMDLNITTTGAGCVTETTLAKTLHDHYCVMNE